MIRAELPKQNGEKKQKPITRLRRFYVACAIVFTNTVVFLLALNIVLGLCQVDDPDITATSSLSGTPDPTTVWTLGPIGHGMDKLRLVYPAMEDHEIIGTILENINVTFIHDPATLYREKPFRGRYVTISAHGFRQFRGQREWPPAEDDFTVFVFGGSTTFGVGLRDEETIPARLQAHLRARSGSRCCVYNFGHRSFFSEQERAEFARLLDSGMKPDIAVFLDGVNEFFNWDGQPTYRTCDDASTVLGVFRRAMVGRPGEWLWPVQRWARRIGKNLTPQRSPVEWFREETTVPPLDCRETNSAVLDRWRKCKERIERLAEHEGVQTLFVMHPVPAYGGYDLRARSLIDSHFMTVRSSSSIWAWPCDDGD